MTPPEEEDGRLANAITLVSVLLVVGVGTVLVLLV
jgi:hypothetical protein